MFSFSLVRGRLKAAAAVSLLAATVVNAQSFSDIQYWVGSGANQAAFVVDWKDGKNPQSLMWGYRWDGAATGEDMLIAIVQSDPRLFANLSTPGSFGVSLNGIGYDVNDSGSFAVSPALTFDAGGLVIGAGVDGRAPVDVADHWREGASFDGYWSYWLGGNGTTPSWDFSPTGMTDRVLTNGTWDGWSYAPNFDGTAPVFPVAAPVPTPGAFALLGVGSFLATRRRRSRRVTTIAPLAALAVVGGIAATASAQFNPNDFAVEVVSSTGFPVSPGLYTDPASVLGAPSTRFYDEFGDANIHRVKLIEATYSTAAPNGQRLITTFNAGQAVTVRMGRTVFDDPANPFGIDLNVFGNSSFTITGGVPGGFADDNANLNLATVGSSGSEPVRVSVSPDNINWYTYSGRTGDGIFPTNAFRWNATSAVWTENLLDPRVPMDPALASMNFNGMTAASVLALYGDSAGGTGFDLATSGFSFINYVRFEGITGFAGGEIDAVAAVPAPGAGLVLGLGGLLVTRRRR